MKGVGFGNQQLHLAPALILGSEHFFGYELTKRSPIQDVDSRRASRCAIGLSRSTVKGRYFLLYLFSTLILVHELNIQIVTIFILTPLLFFLYLILPLNI